MLKVSFYFFDYISVLSYGRECVGIYCKCGEIVKEGDVMLLLVDICEK